MTTTETHRTRRRGDRADDADYDSEAERQAAGALAHRFDELGVETSMAECHELARRLERQGVADLYLTALDTSVAAKRNRIQRREMRRLQGQSA